MVLYRPVLTGLGTLFPLIHTSTAHNLSRPEVSSPMASLLVCVRKRTAPWSPEDRALCSLFAPATVCKSTLCCKPGLISHENAGILFLALHWESIYDMEVECSCVDKFKIVEIELVIMIEFSLRQHKFTCTSCGTSSSQSIVSFCLAPNHLTPTPKQIPYTSSCNLPPFKKFVRIL